MNHTLLLLYYKMNINDLLTWDCEGGGVRKRYKVQ